LARLAREGAPVEAVLFEASDRLGGTVQTMREGGYIVEGGPDGWVTEKPWAQQLAEELGLADEIIPSNDANRKTHILIGNSPGTLQAMPEGMRLMVPGNLEALDACELFSAEAKKAFHDELGRADELRASAATNDETIAEFVRRHFGDEVLHKIGAPLLSGVLGGDVNVLSVRAVMAPFVAMEREYGSLIAAVQARAAAAHGEQRSIFTTLRSGVATLVDRMVATIPTPWIRLGAGVVDIGRDDTGWTIRRSARGSSNELTAPEHFDALIIATPVDVARTLLAPLDAHASKLMEMDSSSAVIVAFGFPDATRFPVPPGFGFLVPSGSGSRLLACTFVDQKFNHRVPQGGRLVRAFFGGAAAERLMRCGNDEITSIARMELARILGPLPDAQIQLVRRLPRSLPQYSVGHLDRMTDLDERIQKMSGLSLLGNGYRGVGLPDLIRDARKAARSHMQ
jgi:oxygen-dependent protoporphyrinogen oxidase